MLTGPTLRTKTLVDSCKVPHVVTILRPDDTPANKSSLLASEKAWRAYQKTQPVTQWHRSRLAIDTAFLSANALGFQRDNHYIVAAQDETGELRGLSIFMFRPYAGDTWELAMHTVGPRDQGGSTEKCQLRGVGSELLGADIALMVGKCCSHTELSPLDDKAAAFWRRRGFVNTDPAKPWTLSCPGMQALAATYAHSPTDDEDMVVDDLSRRAPVSIDARALAKERG